MSAESVVHSLEDGAMKPQAVNLTRAEKHAVAEFVSGKTLRATSTETAGKCPSADGATTGPGWNGWGAANTNARFQTQEASGLAAADVPKLRLRWAFAFPNQSMMAAQPSISGNHLYIGSADGTIYSLNAKSGCVYWQSHAEAGIRAAPSVVIVKEQTLVIFADLAANVYALDANTGKEIWRKKVEEFAGARISGSPQVYAGQIYVPVSSVEENTSYDEKYECCRFRGSVVALDLKTGEQNWKTYTIPDPPGKTRLSSAGTQLWGPSGAGIWSSPTLDPDHNLLYVATGNNYSEPFTANSDAILALELTTGKIAWSRQITGQDIYNGGCETKAKSSCPVHPGPDYDFGSPPVLITLPSGKRLLIASQKSAVVTALDPDNHGAIVWQTRVGAGGPLGGVEWGSSADSEQVYVPLSDTTPVPRKDDDPGLNPNKGGGVFALNVATGKVVWHVSPPKACGGRQHCGPANSAPTTVIPGIVFAGAVDGHVRAYSSRDGQIVWDYDTVRVFHTVNGVSDARGGSIDSAGPVVAGGMLYVVSGYPLWGGMPGDVLLAFSVEGR
jgi:polyvinyl alcohol dehydrogenase (cytochrome)